MQDKGEEICRWLSWSFEVGIEGVLHKLELASEFHANYFENYLYFGYPNSRRLPTTIHGIIGNGYNFSSEISL